MDSLNRRTTTYGSIERNRWIILAVVAFLALLIRARFYVGLNYCDDMFYSKYAAALAENGQFLINNIWGTRVSLWGPIALCYRLFGISHFSIGLYFLFCSLGTVIVSYLLGRLFFNTGTGLLAAFLVAVYPLNVIFGSYATPDVPMTFFQALCVYLLFITPSSKKGLLLARSAAGFLWGFSTNLNISSGIFVFGLLGIFIGSLLCGKKSFREIITADIPCLALGMLCAFMAEGVFFKIVMGDFFYKFRMNMGHFSDIKVPIDFMLIFYKMFMAVPDCEPLTFNTNPRDWDYGAYFVLFTASLPFMLLFKRHFSREVTIPVLWLLLYFAYLRFGSISFREYVPLGIEPRYLSILTVPLVLACAHLLETLLSCRAFIKTAAVILIAGLVATSFMSISHIHRDLFLFRESMRKIYETFSRIPDIKGSVIFSHNDLEVFWEFHSGYHDMIDTEDITEPDLMEQIRLRRDMKMYFVYRSEDGDHGDVMKFLRSLSDININVKFLRYVPASTPSFIYFYDPAVNRSE